ncbi:MAG: gliding motility-associated C-terminal domain-containing protein [Bacteroidota bacterium]
MKSPAKICLVCLLLFAVATSVAQRLPNPSFEGNRGTQSPPDDWRGCLSNSSPDTQPGLWGVSSPASEGRTYAGLVTRGNLGPSANSNEDLQTRLNTPLSQGETYRFSIDMFSSPQFGHSAGSFGFLPYTTPAKLEIYGASNSCRTGELLWESPAIDHSDWQTYAFDLSPTIGDVSFLIFRAAYAQDSTYFGNIMLDNIVECSPLTVDWPVMADTILCQGETLLLDATTFNGSYTWQDGSSSAAFTVSEAGLYTVTVDNGCYSETYSINVVIRDCSCDTAPPIALIPTDTIICEGEVIEIDASIPNGSYRWQTGENTAIIPVSEAGVYTVAVSNECETRSFDFVVTTRSCDCTLTAPNVFTPNGDDVNELFELNGSSDVSRFNMVIVDRSGREVFRSDNLTQWWDGRKNDTPVPEGVYFWHATLACIQGSNIVDNELRGWVTISR